MKRVVLCVLAFLLLGCGCAQTKEDPFRVDTVVVIPVDPTDPPTEEPTEHPTEALTVPPAETQTEAPTEPQETTAPKKTTSYKSSGGKTSSGKNQSSSAQKPQETKPSAAEPVMPPALMPEQPPYNPAAYTVGELEHTLLQELNRYRLEAEIGELTMNELLCGVAHLRAQEACVLWSHARPDGRGYTSVLTDYGFENEQTAELMLQGSVDVDAAYYAAKWMGYKVSNKDICTAEYTTAGIGVYTHDGITYVVCLLIG